VTDEDLIHEFDTPVVTGQERITLGNIGYEFSAAFWFGYQKIVKCTRFA